MSLFIIDVESDGPIPGKYSMVNFGIVRVDNNLRTSFYGKVKPISDLYIEDALKVSGFSREEHLQFNDPAVEMKKAVEWVKKNNAGGNPVFISDNPAFDWQFFNWYCHTYVGENPFGYSARRIGDFYAGLTKNFRNATEWKSLRKTKHTHNPVDDARGNAEALIEMCRINNIELLPDNAKNKNRFR